MGPWGWQAGLKKQAYTGDTQVTHRTQRAEVRDSDTHSRDTQAGTKIYYRDTQAGTKKYIVSPYNTVMPGNTRIK